MATINLYKVYNNKLRKLGYSDSATLQDAFVEAVNNVHAELNDQVFQGETLGHIGSFDDVIDNRLISFSQLDFDADSINVISDLDFWSVEYKIDKLAADWRFKDYIIDPAQILLSFANGVLSITSGAIEATGTVTDATSLEIKFSSSPDGNSLTINGDSVALTYTVGDASTYQPIGTVASRRFDSVNGCFVKRMRFLTPDAVLMDFRMDDAGSKTTVDEINGFVGTFTSPIWETVWVEPSSALSTKYLSAFNMGIDYHLQDGGQWAIEPEESRERKWYGRGIPMARNIFQGATAYTNPLGI